MELKTLANFVWDNFHRVHTSIQPPGTQLHVGCFKLMMLPVDIWEHVLCASGVYNVISLMRTSKHWHRTIQMEMDGVWTFYMSPFSSKQSNINYFHYRFHYKYYNWKQKLLVHSASWRIDPVKRIYKNLQNPDEQKIRRMIIFKITEMQETHRFPILIIDATCYVINSLSIHYGIANLDVHIGDLIYICLTFVSERNSLTLDNHLYDEQYFNMCCRDYQNRSWMDLIEQNAADVSTTHKILDHLKWMQPIKSVQLLAAMTMPVVLASIEPGDDKDKDSPRQVFRRAVCFFIQTNPIHSELLEFPLCIQSSCSLLCGWAMIEYHTRGVGSLSNDMYKLFPPDILEFLLYVSDTSPHICFKCFNEMTRLADKHKALPNFGIHLVHQLNQMTN